MAVLVVTCKPKKVFLRHLLRDSYGELMVDFWMMKLQCATGSFSGLSQHLAAHLHHTFLHPNGLNEQCYVVLFVFWTTIWKPGVRMSTKKMCFSASKGLKQLGQQTTIAQQQTLPADFRTKKCWHKVQPPKKSPIWMNMGCFMMKRSVKNTQNKQPRVFQSQSPETMYLLLRYGQQCLAQRKGLGLRKRNQAAIRCATCKSYPEIFLVVLGSHIVDQSCRSCKDFCMGTTAVPPEQKMVRRPICCCRFTASSSSGYKAPSKSKKTWSSDESFIEQKMNEKVTFEKTLIYMDFTRAGDAPLS